LIVKADAEDLKKKADVSLVNTKVDHKLMQVTIQRSMTPLESAFSNFMDLMKKQMENAVSQNELGKVMPDIKHLHFVITCCYSNASYSTGPKRH
jgi:hypothetical protein